MVGYHTSDGYTHMDNLKFIANKKGRFNALKIQPVIKHFSLINQGSN